MPSQPPSAPFRGNFEENTLVRGTQEPPVENLRFDPFHHILYRVLLHPDAAYALHDVEPPSEAARPVDCGPEPEDLDARFQWHVGKRVQAALSGIIARQQRQAHARRRHAGYHAAVRGLKAHEPLYARTMDVAHLRYRARKDGLCRARSGITRGLSTSG